mmetsp:Transcript_27135/g.61294  ORF Transcript_27135/g.61294 Transcript_27135/m.61294 type:complete len:307 (+) Transcript_27135:138-1058(+)
MLVKHNTTGETYAMKMLRKENIVKRNQVEHTQTERNVLGSMSHPFIVDLKFAFQTPTKLYFVLEYCAGGELFYHLSRAGKFDEGRTRFYSGELLLALEHLHSFDTIYRDLKPENVLMDAEGHLKLTDFGLSKEGIHDNMSAKTMCGTPEYLAPEILDQKGHGKAVDWYSLGALVYEMLTGLPPYYTRDREKLFERIRRGELSYPAHVSPVAKSLMQTLLLKDHMRRLGSTNDAAEIKAHAFYQPMDFDALYAKRIAPPFQPTLASSDATKYVDKEFLAMPVVNSEAADASSRDVAHFAGFTYQAEK